MSPPARRAAARAAMRRYCLDHNDLPVSRRRPFPRLRNLALIVVRRSAEFRRARSPSEVTAGPRAQALLRRLPAQQLGVPEATRSARVGHETGLRSRARAARGARAARRRRKASPLCSGPRAERERNRDNRLNKAPELHAAEAATAARFKLIAEQRAALRAVREEAAAAQGYAAAAAPAGPPDAALATSGGPPAAGAAARRRKRKRSAEEQVAEAARSSSAFPLPRLLRLLLKRRLRPLAPRR